MAITKNKNLYDGGINTANLRKTHDWDSIEISIQDTTPFQIYMVSDITYKEAYPLSPVRGRKNLIYGYGSTNGELSASMVISVYELDLIMEAADLTGDPFNDSTRKVQNIAPFDVNITYKKPNQDGTTSEKLVTLKNCTLDNYEVSTKLGDSDTNVTVNLNPNAILIGAWKVI